MLEDAVVTDDTEALLAEWLAHLAHVLPAQAPIADFVHHNTLHGFEHLPFAEALAAARQTLGVEPYWPESRFRAAWDEGRIVRDDLLAALSELGLPGLAESLMPGVTGADVFVAALRVDRKPPAPAQRAWLQREGRVDAPGLQHCRELLAQGQAAIPDEDWQLAANRRWLAWCDQVGRQITPGQLLARLSGERWFEAVQFSLQRQLAAHLDQGLAAWANPQREAGFYAAWRAAALADPLWEMEELPGLRDEIAALPAQARPALFAALRDILPDESLWLGLVEGLLMRTPGWSGMVLWRHLRSVGTGATVDFVDYLAVLLILERHLCAEAICRLTGAPLGLDELRGHFCAHPAEFVVREAVFLGRADESLLAAARQLLQASDPLPADWEDMAAALRAAEAAQTDDGESWRLLALLEALELAPDSRAALSPATARQLLALADRLDDLPRRHLWLLAYEHHYRQQLFAALAANAERRRQYSLPSAQVICCMDDREEGTRRHLEEVAPEIQTWGAAGFFGVAMWWQGMDEARPQALCPVVVQPGHLLRELPRTEAEALAARRAQRRSRRLRWRARLYQATRREFVLGSVLTGLAGLPALAALTASSLAPGWFAAALQRSRLRHEPELPTRVRVQRVEPNLPPGDEPSDLAGLPDGVVAGFSDAEQVDRVHAFLCSIGLIRDFAPLVLLLGHGSSSRNNPHRSAYDCGACSGRHGGPNARVFATLANRPVVRAGLAARGLVVPETTWFVAAEHDTCDDRVQWYDLDSVPQAWQVAADRLVAQVAEACRRHAVERCRRLASAPPRPTPWQARAHVAARAADLAQPRPELGHATNAAALIGRRAMSRGLFLDRRVFLISYDPVSDTDGRIVESILLAAGPVGAGIALEYYFSSVDNERLGSGSKITHNLCGLFGVMEGTASDLRTGLPWQMVEIHEPMRLLVVVEQTTERLSAILARQPALQRLVGNEWIILAACTPSTAEISRYCPRRGWLPWTGAAVLPQVACSADWFAGEADPLPPALLLGASP